MIQFLKSTAYLCAGIVTVYGGGTWLQWHLIGK